MHPPLHFYLISSSYTCPLIPQAPLLNPDQSDQAIFNPPGVALSLPPFLSLANCTISNNPQDSSS